jgi:hypothetical protein
MINLGNVLPFAAVLAVGVLFWGVIIWAITSWL